MAAKTMSLRDKMKAQLKEKTKANAEKRDQGGSKAYLALPKGKSLFVLKEGACSIDIIPYLITSLNHPLVVKGKAEVGNSDYILQVFVHQGLTEKPVICLSETFDKPCPICKRRAIAKREFGELSKEDYKKHIGSLFAKKREIYLIVCNNTQEEVQKGVQIFETSEYLFGSMLNPLCKRTRAIQGKSIETLIIPSDPDKTDGDKGGRIVCFTVQKEKGDSFEYLKPSGFSLDDRDYNISDEILEQAFDISDCLNIPKLSDGLFDFEGYAAKIAEEIGDGFVKPKATKASAKQEKTEKIEKTEEPEEEAETEETEDFTGKCVFGKTDKGEDDVLKLHNKLDDCSTCDVWEECHEYCVNNKS